LQGARQAPMTRALAVRNAPGSGGEKMPRS
jgi:hypothetical protein